MADYGGLPLWRDAGTPGVLLPLVDPPPVSARYQCRDGVELEIRRGLRAVVVRNMVADAPMRPGTEVTVLANEGLDLLSASGVASCSLGDSKRSFMSWETVDADLVLRISSEGTMSFRAQAGGFVRDDESGEILFKPTASLWHRSFRYFRLSQTTTDLFDAFRNLYLALEANLIELSPRRNSTEGEWLKGALEEAGRRHDLNRILERPSTDPAEALYRELWQEVRNKVFHAKTGSSSFLPLDRAPREKVLSTLLRFAGLYTTLAEPIMGARYLRSSLGIAAFAGLQTMTHKSQLTVTADDTPFWKDDEDISPRHLPVLRLETEPDQDEENPLRACLVGRNARRRCPKDHRGHSPDRNRE